MKRHHIYSLMLSAVAVAGTMFISSCSDYDYMSEEEINLYETEKEFADNFIARFGMPDPNHNWGFGPIKGNPTTRVQVPNKNEWDEVYHLVVPGWPDTYKKINDNTTYGKNSYNNKVGDKSVAEAAPGNEPAGDVTDEEIKYVSWWFRTHRNPTSLEVHWSDFYVQEVSSDVDRDVNGNPVHKATILKKTGNDNKNWVVDGYRDLQFGIDKLEVKTKGGDFDHIYNFNAGASNSLKDCVNLPMYGATENAIFGDLKKSDNSVATTNRRLIAFYQSSGTENFQAEYSDDNKVRSNYNGNNIWVMVHLHFVGESGRIYDGYYLAFDYTCYIANETEYVLYEPDGYYSNWILKITPGTPKEDSGFTKRVMCEDLGNTYDLDFDDVVFDVTYNITETQRASYQKGDKVDATITLQAAGGTMPIWVGKNPNGNLSDGYEAHHMFSYPYTTPINVDKNLGLSEVVNYHVDLYSIDPDDVGIWVYNTRMKEWYNLAKSVKDDTDGYNPPGYDNSKTRVPQKFAVPTSVLWLKETHQIEQGYPHFGDWVKDAGTTWSEGGTTPWFTTDIVSDHLCGWGGSSNTPGGINPDSGLPGTTSTSKGYTHTVSVLVNDKTWGTVTADGVENGYGIYDTKTSKTLTLTAVPNDGYEFWYWNVNGYGANDEYLNQNNKGLNTPTLTVNVTKDVVVFAVFKTKN